MADANATLELRMMSCNLHNVDMSSTRVFLPAGPSLQHGIVLYAQQDQSAQPATQEFEV